MARIAVRKIECLWVETGQEQGNKEGIGAFLGDVPIDQGQDLAEIALFLGKGPQVSPGLDHEQCRSDAVPAGIANGHAQTAIGQRQVIVIVASRLLGGPHSAGDVQARQVVVRPAGAAPSGFAVLGELLFPFDQNGLGLAALNELGDLAADTAEHVQQIGIGLADGHVAKFQDAEDRICRQDGRGQYHMCNPPVCRGPDAEEGRGPG